MSQPTTDESDLQRMNLAFQLATKIAAGEATTMQNRGDVQDRAYWFKLIGECLKLVKAG
jgi:hypothetical protein